MAPLEVVNGSSTPRSNASWCAALPLSAAARKVVSDRVRRPAAGSHRADLVLHLSAGSGGAVPQAARRSVLAARSRAAHATDTHRRRATPSSSNQDRPVPAAMLLGGLSRFMSSHRRRQRVLSFGGPCHRCAGSRRPRVTTASDAMVPTGPAGPPATSPSGLLVASAASDRRNNLHSCPVNA
jgi:hypothetical protein